MEGARFADQVADVGFASVCLFYIIYWFSFYALLLFLIEYGYTLYTP